MITTYPKQEKDVSGCTCKNGGAFFKPVIQAKLNINEPGDKYEQEADAVADQVMRMQDTRQNYFFSPVPEIQKKCAGCSDEEKKMHRKENDAEETTTDAMFENYVNSLDTAGQPLPASERNFYEPRFGYDFGNVKIHTDTAAATSAKSINALAYTSGNNIVFNTGQYSPGTETGKKLIAHELTHVVQQSKNVSKKIQRVDDASFEASSGVDQGIANNTMTSDTITGQTYTVNCGLRDYTVSFRFTKAYKGVYPYVAGGRDVKGIYVKIEASITDHNYCGRCTPLRLLQSVRNITRGSSGDIVTADPDNATRRERSGWSDPNAPSRGWRIDRIVSATQPYYTSGSNGQEGSETSPAILWDAPGDWSTDTNAGKEFYTCAVCQNLASRRWTAACVSWGYYIDSSGAITFRPATPVATCGNPQEVKDAATRWDAIRGNTTTGLTP